MSRHATLVKELADRLRAMDVASLVYFHTDHFEPWRPIGDAPAVGPEVVDAVGDFCRTTERIDFARRLTLFYKPHLNYALREGEGVIRADSRDLVGFLPRSAHEERCGRDAMREVAGTAHDIQVHIHHEYYTATTAHTDPAVINWFAGPLGRALDGQRLELAIRLNREIIARETGRNTTRWFFVHGHWALNGSDDTSCTITNEIDILLRNGCRGDFTFPAGRKHVNPRIAVPYLCRPFDAPKGYDLPEAEPEIAFGNAAAAAGKFFIWASPASALQCSLDYMSRNSQRHLEDTEKAAGELIDNAYIAGGRLFIKTHAHSMHPHYYEHARIPIVPHQYPPTQTLLSVIFEAAGQAGLDVQFLTVPEVYDLVVSADTQPDVDLVESYMKPEGKRVPAPYSPARVRALVRESSIAVLRQRIDALGVRGSGAYDHYNSMLQQGLPIPAYELAALDIVRRHVPRLSAYHEIGSGVGILPFMLALSGFPAVGIESDRRRHETAQAIWLDLSGKAKAGKSICKLVHGRFPAAMKSEDTSGALAIFTDFVTSQTPEQRYEILNGLKRYPYVLLDLRRFCLMREEPEAQGELLSEFGEHGFAQASEVMASTESAFVLLHNKAVIPRSRFALWSSLKQSWRNRPARRAAPEMA